MRRASRTDSTQSSIVRALRKIGAQVVVIGQPVDLLVAYKKRTFLVECKTDKGRLTTGQDKFLEAWKGEWHIVRTAEQAVAAARG